MSDKLKKAVRERMARTGERYTTARAALLAEREAEKARAEAPDTDTDTDTDTEIGGGS